MRTSYEALRSEFNDLGRRSVASETEIERLRHELEIVQQAAPRRRVAQQTLAALETTKASNSRCNSA